MAWIPKCVDRFDREELVKSLEEADAAREGRLAEEYAQTVARCEEAHHQSDRLASALGADRAELERGFAEIRAGADALLERRPPPPARGRCHNPVMTPPYEIDDSYLGIGGAGTAELNGPHTATGIVGAELGAVLAGSAVSWAGLGGWEGMTKSGMLEVTAHAEYSGVFAAYAWLFGYAYAHARLRLNVDTAWLGGDYEWVSHRAEATIYQQAGCLLSDKAEPEDRITSVTLRVPVQGSTMCRIWAGAHQLVFAAGLAVAISNVTMRVISISATVE